MSTPRAESIAHARSGDYTPIPTPDESPVENRVRHYAALANVIHETLQAYTTDSDIIESLANAPSIASLRRQFTDSLTERTLSVLESSAFSDVHAQLQQSQTERARRKPGMWDDVRSNLSAGAATFVNTTEAIYDILHGSPSPEAADSAHSAQLLDRLAKLGISQFIPYRGVYLETYSNRWKFLEQLEGSGNGVRFKPGYPLDAVIPSVLASAQNMRSESDFHFDGQPTIALKHVPQDGAALGCPITFYSGQVTELWTMYGAARRSLRQRHQLGSRAASAYS